MEERGSRSYLMDLSMKGFLVCPELGMNHLHGKLEDSHCSGYLPVKALGEGKCLF